MSEPTTPNGNSASFATRTVAVIKPHALKHRFEIERRITEAGFEVTKERQMMFHAGDKDVEELFGKDAMALGEDPVWVYVLERRRAVEVWNTLMGDEDPVIAREQNANSIRALFGESLEENAVFGSPDTATAEYQISILFAGSPPFRATDLPDSRMGSLRSITSSVLSELNRRTADEPGAEYAGQPATSVKSADQSSSGGTVNRRASSSGFRARPVPASNRQVAIEPRGTRAAALRATGAQPKIVYWHEGPRAPLTKEEHERTFANVPGHKRAESIAVASTAAPTIAPRMTRAASLRQGKSDTSPTKPKIRDPNAAANTFEGVPGHKRKESLSVASVQAPTVAPRLNKSAQLRAEKEKAPPTSYMFRTPSATQTPTISRRPSTSSGVSTSSLSRSSSLSELNRPASVKRISSTPAAPSAYKPGRASVILPRTNSTPPARPASVTGRPSSALGGTAPTPASLGKPTIAPRQNKSALLRAQKMQEEAAAAAKAGNKLGGKPLFV